MSARDSLSLSLALCLPFALFVACAGGDKGDEDDEDDNPFSDDTGGGGGIGGGVGGDSGGGSGGNQDIDGDGYKASEDCDDTDADVNPGAEEIQGNGVDDDCNEKTCVAQDFASSRGAWSLPSRWQDGTGEEDWTATASGGYCYSSQSTSTYALVDLDGDGLSDLVETWHCGEDAVGDTEWWVYKNTGSGFSSSRSSWTLPSRWQEGTGEEDWTATASGGYCYSSQSTSTYALVDLDGDGLSDLVETWHCGEDAVGDTEWWVYKNTGSGFSSSRAKWSLPSRWQDGTGDEDWTATASGGYCYSSQSTSTYTIADLDGDGLSDLVETWHCGEDAVGDTEWWVYKNSGSGFSSSRSSWTLPTRWYDGTGEEDWTATASGGYCYSSQSTSTYAVFDLNGDGRSELVETWHCGEDAVGDSEWWVYGNTGSGFSSTRTKWALPSRWQEGTGDEDWTATASGGYCYSSQSTSTYTVADLDGNGTLDLVETWHCGEDDVGAGEWWMYSGECDL